MAKLLGNKFRVPGGFVKRKEVHSGSESEGEESEPEVVSESWGRTRKEEKWLGGIIGALSHRIGLTPSVLSQRPRTCHLTPSWFG